MKGDKEIIKVLSSIRHDWLNVMQLIKGNVALGYYDRVDTIIDDAVFQTANESRLCSLDLPKTAVTILEKKYSQMNHVLDIEVDGVLFSLAKYDEQLAHAFSQFFLSYDTLLKNDTSHLHIVFTFFDSSCLIEISSDHDLNNEEVLYRSLDSLNDVVKIETVNSDTFGVTVLIEV
ncbi:Spo0B domain-containing protein [Shouchella sp. 1P09AA]|uniref:Spo0B domain-containing protein n=1 Tax=unclassified Shouchella TaxID=2893065 RepID=UPI0039A0F0AC